MLLGKETEKNGEILKTNEMLNNYWSRLSVSFVTARIKQNTIAFNVMNNNDSIFRDAIWQEIDISIFLYNKTRERHVIYWFNKVQYSVVRYDNIRILINTKNIP